MWRGWPKIYAAVMNNEVTSRSRGSLGPTGENQVFRGGPGVKEERLTIIWAGLCWGKSNAGRTDEKGK